MSDCSPGYSREGPFGGLREIHGEPTRAEIAPKLLAEKHLYIRFVVDHKNEKVHERSPE